MPVIKSAQKKLRKDKKRRQSNKKFEDLLKVSLKKALKKPTLENVKVAIKIIDKAASKNIIHKNKAARLKSKLAKLAISKKPAITETRRKKETQRKRSKKRAREA